MHWYVTGDMTRAATIARAVAAEGLSIQLRAPAETDVGALASELRAITRAAGVRFVVNRRLELARAVGADGVHVGSGAVADARAAWPDAWITAPCHDEDELRAALAGGANALFVSPIFATPGERKGAPRGVEALARARALVRDASAQASVVALGGITLANAASCIAAGADEVAAIRLFEEARDAGRSSALAAELSALARRP